jgi:Fis family transcriptional regulator
MPSMRSSKNNFVSASGYNTGPQPPLWMPWQHKKWYRNKKNQGQRCPQSSAYNINQPREARKMSKESIQEVVQKSLEEYFNDLGEQQASNIYDMVVLTVERPILEVVMTRAEGNQSHAAQMLGINRNTLRKKLQEHGLL